MADPKRNKKFAISVTVATAVVFAAAFMPWGEFTGEMQSPFGNRSPSGRTPFQGMQMTITLTAWNGNITPGGLKLPHWLVVLAAAGVTALCWLKACSVWEAPAVVPFALAAYGLFHAAFVWVTLMSSDKGSAGVGSFLTAVAFVAILVVLVQQVRGPRPTSPA